MITQISSIAVAVSSTSTLFIDISLSHAVVGPDSLIQIGCVVNSTHPSTYTWFDGGNNQISPDNTHKLYDNGTLEISEFSKQDEGEYYCVASNSLGSAKSPLAEILVACKTKQLLVMHTFKLPDEYHYYYSVM